MYKRIKVLYTVEGENKNEPKMIVVRAVLNYVNNYEKLNQIKPK